MGEIERAMGELDRLHWTRSIMADLSVIHRQYGSPERYVNLMNSGLKTLPFISYAKIGPLFGYESEAVDAYNHAVKLAYACIGWEFIGLCSAVVYGAPRTKRPWDDYVQAGEKRLHTYFHSAEAFEDFDVYMLEPARGAIGASS